MVRYVRIVVWFMKTVFSRRSFVVDASVAQIDEICFLPTAVLRVVQRVSKKIQREWRDATSDQTLTVIGMCCGGGYDRRRVVIDVAGEVVTLWALIGACVGDEVVFLGTGLSPSPA